MKLFFANWKMYLTYDQELNFVKKNLDEILQFQNLILCPSFLSIAQIREMSGGLKLGAQNCSANNLGAYTSEIAAESLKELNINYTVIGHIEVRQNFGETKESIAQKAIKLLKNNITPIICIGETVEEKYAGIAKDKFKKEIEFYKNCKIDLQKCLIAYEPIWAISNTVLPTVKDLLDIAEFLKDLSQTKILYGGGINSKNISEFNKLEVLAGFLIGKASTDFDELKKILIINYLAQSQ